MMTYKNLKLETCKILLVPVVGSISYDSTIYKFLVVRILLTIEAILNNCRHPQFDNLSLHESYYFKRCFCILSTRSYQTLITSLFVKYEARFCHRF